MIICHSHKFIFVHIHKTGGTSMERALDPHLAWNDLILGGSAFGEKIQQPYAKKFGLNKHSTLSSIEEVCGRQIVADYYVFALVRHPVARACSMYNFVATVLHRWAEEQNIDPREMAQHVTPQAAKKKPALKWASTRAFLRTENFSEFIRDCDLAQSQSFSPQVSWLGAEDNKPLKAQFFRLEESQDWTGPLGDRLGIEFAFPKANESDLKILSESEIGPDDRAYLQELFRPDYQILGYSP